MAAPSKKMDDDYFSTFQPSNRRMDQNRSRTSDRWPNDYSTPGGPRTPGRRMPPPVPVRRTQPDYRPMFTSPYGGYGGYGPSMFGSGMYGSYNSYNRNPLSNFVRLAEDSSRPAFESMENIVQAFGSIAMVLESTYFAVQSSFRAVLGLAEHFSRLRVQMTQMISAFTLFKTLRYIYRKLLIFLRLRSQQTTENDDIWSELASAKNVLAGDGVGSSRRRSSWPLLLFFCIVIGGPYLIWRLMASINEQPGDDWMRGESEHYVGLAEYDYDAENDDELSLTVNQELKIAPKILQPRIKGWLLASVDGEKSGLIPANYVRVRGKRLGKSSDQTRMQAPPTSALRTTQRHDVVWRNVAENGGDSTDNGGECEIQNGGIKKSQGAVRQETDSSSANESERCSPQPSADSAISLDHDSKPDETNPT